jgi:hypothetical protein
MFVPIVFVLQNEQFILDKNDRIVEGYNTSVLRHKC